MNVPEGGMQIQQDSRVQLRIALNMPIGCLLWIIDIELSKGGLVTIWWNKSSHGMMECTMNVE